ncbi:Methyltransferase type 11 [Pseudopedobacter saltans DSM 12145]|uniref:Methyltransferase type 11 n=1 Tax=Pseudopedobacter saltans (strain ATCC 51119 / DSM 12145 / JCM 21818 / CCUG 39354 / LMG 10337 / NBRC 100064 / NCIMB 13643) TaxID=762903 RepID=F0SB75_PSESL|nr:class I SAM-dependent methyltransferase [Pseudopedobacter saltans]ADY52710.1 Methyltransferase type 11 [Pseudopedobacter saltans DSM 12145]
MKKSTIEEIRKRFDHNVERFSNLDTGQQTIIDAGLCLELITDAAKMTIPKAKKILDIGCGAGNYTIKVLQQLPNLDCTLVDLSLPMLNKAVERISKLTNGNIETIQGNILELPIRENEYCIVMAGAVLHHLRSDDDWYTVFKKIYNALKPNGSFWICDLISHDVPAIQHLFERNYGEFLEKLGGTEYKEHVLDYIDKEDSPRSVTFQTDLLKKVGFKQIDILHKNSCFAAFGAIK